MIGAVTYPLPTSITSKLVFLSSLTTKLISAVLPVVEGVFVMLHW